MKAGGRWPGHVGLVSDPYEAATGAVCVVVCTEWPRQSALAICRRSAGRLMRTVPTR